MNMFKKLIFPALLLFTAGLLRAQTPDANGIVYVKSGAAGDGSGWANALPELATALKAAKTNTAIKQVWVAKGTYKPQFKASDLSGPNPAERFNAFVLVKDVKVYGGFDPANGRTDLSTRDPQAAPTILSGDMDNTPGLSAGDAYHVVVAAGAMGTAELNGFTITGGNANNASAGAVIINGAALTGYEGGGIWLQNGAPVISKVIVDGNNAIQGAGISAYSTSLDISYSIVRNNTAQSYFGGGIVIGAIPSITITALIRNTLIINNTAASKGGGLYHYNNGPGTTTLINVTLSNNAAASGGGLFNEAGSLTVYNSILWNNKKSGSTTDPGADIEGGSAALKNSVTQGYSTGNTADNNKVNTDPVFTNAAGGDYTLKNTSPVINTGNNALYPGLDAGTKDLAGNSRVYNFSNGGIIDPGAYESSYTPLGPDANGIIYVRPTASGTGDGSSWANAMADLHNAIPAAGVQKVFVAVGNYDVGANSFVMKNNVAIYGGFDPDNGIVALSDNRILPNRGTAAGSVLNGQSVRPVIWNIFTANAPLDNTAIIDGFTLTNGAGAYGAGFNMAYASPVLRNLVIKNNIAGAGGGIHLRSSSPLISDVVIAGNSATQASAVGGGGLYLITSNPVLTNVAIINNQATAGPGPGGISNDNGLPVLNNVTIAGNSAPAIGNTGGSGSTTIQNSIISQPVTNTAVISGTYTAQYSYIQGNTNTANGNIDATGITEPDIFNNPAAGDYTLRSSSPVMNKGSNGLYPGLDANTKDLAGKARLFGTTIDLGAYEYQDSPLPVLFAGLSAIIKDGQLLVNWRTETETNNDHFLVQVSADGIHWNTVQTVQSHAEYGNSDTPLEYNSVIPLAALRFGAGLLLLGALARGRRKYGFIAAVMLLSAVAFSCNKREVSQWSGQATLLVRIVQVDKDGGERVSKVVKVTRE